MKKELEMIPFSIVGFVPLEEKLNPNACEFIFHPANCYFKHARAVHELLLNNTRDDLLLFHSLT